MPNATFRMVQDHYVGSHGVAHVYFKQTFNGIDVDNGNFNVNVGSDGTIISYENDFYSGDPPSPAQLTKRAYADPVHALGVLTSALGLDVDHTHGSTEPKNHNINSLAQGQTNDSTSFYIRNTTGAARDPEAALVYMQNGDGKLGLAWKLHTELRYNHFASYVEADGENVMAVVDYVLPLASYKVFPFWIQDPAQGVQIVIEDPWSTTSSPFTWQGVDGHGAFHVASGNNAVAQFNPLGNNDYVNLYRPRSESREFVYPDYVYDGANETEFVDAAITQVFYTVNMYHDLLYALGFTESAGNFQYNNGDSGGQGGDFVILDVLAGLDTVDKPRNNAFFSTPPDGTSGKMSMFMWEGDNGLMRDGAFDRSIVIHEYTHGLSVRLTGGPAASECLGAFESQGMGEGWSDAMSNALSIRAHWTRQSECTIGAWASGSPNGIRAHPYSTSMDKNPLTYQAVNGETVTHSVGTVWASMLYEVMWNIIDKVGMDDGHGWDVQFDGDDIPIDGRFLTMTIVMAGLALQPCNPNFIDARDAILDGDTSVTGGAYQCEIWKGFAKRGLGQNAAYHDTQRTEDFTTPDGVCPEDTAPPPEATSTTSAISDELSDTIISISSPPNTMITTTRITIPQEPSNTAAPPSLTQTATSGEPSLDSTSPASIPHDLIITIELPLPLPLPTGLFDKYFPAPQFKGGDPAGESAENETSEDHDNDDGDGDGDDDGDDDVDDGDGDGERQGWGQHESHWKGRGTHNSQHYQPGDA